jgi:hypothetical protein
VSTAAAPGRPARSWIDRLLAALPIAGLVLVIVTFYGYEAWLRRTPWLFSDEDEWAQISRAIAMTGHAARRGVPTPYKSLYAYLIAPMWWFKSTHTAYAAIKYLNSIVMAAAALPTYFLARMMVGKRAALAAAVLAIAIPAMSYATFLIPEPLAYPWFALSSWLIVRALTTKRRRDIALAIVCTLVAVKVREELVVLVPAFALAAAGLWVTGPRGRALRKDWTRWDTAGALVLLTGANVLLNRILSDHSYQWNVTSEFYKDRMVNLGLDAASAFAIGLGLLPVIGGLTSLRLPERKGDPAYRAFCAFLATSTIFVGLYTATKAAYISTTFSTLTEERNLFYLSPLMLVGTMLVLEVRVFDWRLLTVASGFVLYLALERPYQLGYPYYEAPGYSILAIVNRNFDWTLSATHWALFLAWAVGIALLLAARRHISMRVLLTTLLLAWLLTGEIGATAGDLSFGSHAVSYLPPTFTWVDRLTHGQKVTYLTVPVSDDNDFWLTEFWNRDIAHVDGLGGPGPGPGPYGGPSLLSPDGELSEDTGTPYVLTNNGVTLQAQVVKSYNAMILYRVHGVWKLHDNTTGVYPDGWMGTTAAWTYFPVGTPGVLTVDLRRTGFNGTSPFGHATIVVGTVKLDVNKLPVIKDVVAIRHAIVTNGANSDVKVHIHLATTPLRVRVTIPQYFVPSASDTRHLTAQVEFSFKPDKP